MTEDRRGRRFARLALCAAIAALTAAATASCHTGPPECHLPPVPSPGTSGHVVVSHGTEAGGSLEAQFGGRSWATAAPAAQAGETGAAVVTSSAGGPELVVRNSDGRALRLALVPAACA